MLLTAVDIQNQKETEAKEVLGADGKLLDQWETEQVL